MSAIWNLGVKHILSSLTVLPFYDPKNEVSLDMGTFKVSTEMLNVGNFPLWVHVSGWDRCLGGGGYFKGAASFIAVEMYKQ